MTTITVTIDKAITIDDRTFAVAGEMGVALTVNVDASIQSLGTGKLTYLDFLQPDGTAYYKGDYDCSSGTFAVTLGATDTVLAYAGDLWIQLVIRDALPPTGVEVWKSNRLKVVVGESVNATIPATIAIVPPLDMPATYPAETVTIADAGTLITSTNVEDALQEIVTESNELAIEIEEKIPRNYLENVFASLDMREDVEITIAHASDSTGDAADEYFELAWQQCFADIWPERPARVCRWWTGGGGGAGAYGAWEDWQAGTTPYTLIYADSFPTNSATVIGTLTPAVGSQYTEYAPHSASWSVVSNKLKVVGASGTRWQLQQFLPGSRATEDLAFYGKVMVPSGATSTYETEMYIGRDNLVSRVGLVITAAGALTLAKRFSGVTTVLETFAAGTIVLDEEADFMISIVGTTLTGTVNGVTKTATLSAGEVTDLYSNTEIFLRSQVQNTTFDLLRVTTPLTTSKEKQVSVYNGGAAGQTAEYQRTKIQEMYPVRPDLLFINHGHNYSEANGWTTQEMIDSITAFVDELNELYPGDNPIPVAITSQNPQFGTGRESEHLLKIKALKALAMQKNWGYIPTFEVFAQQPDGGASLMNDEVHPGIGTGRVLMGGIAENWIKSQTKRLIL